MKTLVLDLGGVFYAANEPDRDFWRRWAGPCDLDAETLAAGFWHGPDVEAANIGQLSFAGYCRRAGDRLGAPADVVRNMLEELWVGEFNDVFADFTRDLRDRGVPVSAMTNSWSSEAQIKQRPGLAGLFDRVISSSEVGAAKPGEAIYRIAITRLGVEASDVVFVDDSPANVETALVLRWDAVRFVSTEQAIAAIGERFA